MFGRSARAAAWAAVLLGLLGSRPALAVCDNDGVCEPSIDPTIGETAKSGCKDCGCGDGWCEPGWEDPLVCPADCGCGNGRCDAFENPGNCAADCGCGDGRCEKRFEDPASCAEDCGCGNDICNWPSYEEPGDVCGDCPDPPSTCGNGKCDEQEDCFLCPGDCGPCGFGCGDFVCAEWETPESCPPDCGLAEADCKNDADDDLDGLPDCADPDCDGAVCGTLCSPGECQGGACAVVSHIDCSKEVTGNECTVKECNPLTGTCHEVDLPKGTDCTGVTLTDARCQSGGCDAGSCVVFNEIDGTTCQDGDSCTDPDVCQGGKCTTTAVNCDPGNPCVRFSCDSSAASAGKDACLYQTDVSLPECVCDLDGVCDPGEACPCPDCCECDTAGAPKISEEVSLSWPFAVECPAIGGDAGVTIGVEGSYENQVPNCEDECVGNEKASLGASVEVGLCSGLQWTVDAGFAVDTVREHCLTCDLFTCDIGCVDGQYCLTEQTDVGAGLEVSRFFGWESTFEVGEEIGFPAGFGAKCGATLKAKVGVSGSRTVKEDHAECKSCDECEEVSAHVGVGPEASLGCEASARLGPWTKSLGCDDCARAEITVGADIAQPCEGDLCVAGSITAGIEYGLGPFALGAEVWPVGFQGLEFSCGGELYGTCRVSSDPGCGETGCDALEGELLDCSVEPSGGVRTALKALGVI